MKKILSLTLMIFTLAACQSGSCNVESDIEKELEKIGLQNVAEEIPEIEVYMVYATPYNFMRRVLYEELDEAYLVPEAIEKLRLANEILRKKRRVLVQSSKRCGMLLKIPIFKTMWQIRTRAAGDHIIMELQLM